MSSGPAPEAIARDARWLVQALDPAAGLVRLIEMDRAAYRAASFLDDRMLKQPVTAKLVPWAEASSAIRSEARRDARWIFHIGHVGSTLIARLLGEIETVLSIREPRFLRDLTGVPTRLRADYAGPATALFSRTFAPTEIALVKATSFVSEMAPELVPPGERTLFLYARPDAYVASILAGENSVQELRILAPSRAERMAVRVSGLGDLAAAADYAAAAWACEMTSLEAAAETMADRRIAWMDFDRALDAMPSELARTADFFDFSASPERLAEIAHGPLMSRYSKALEFEYSPRLRRDLIDEATRNNRPEIGAALAKLERAAESSPLLARALDRGRSEG